MTAGNRVLLAHAAAESRPWADAFTLDGPAEVEGSTRGAFAIATAASGRDAVAAIGRGIDNGQPIAVVFLDGRRTSRWDGLDVLCRLWRMDPRVEVALCVPEAADSAMVEDFIAEIGESEQLVLVDPPYRPAKMRLIAQILATKWRLARAAEQPLAADQASQVVSFLEPDEEAPSLTDEATERTRVQGQPSKAPRLEALGRLAASLGHEINNPLSFMIASAEDALAGLDEAERANRAYSISSLRDKLDTILVGAERIRAIVGSVKLLAHQADNTAESIDLRAALKVAVDMVTRNCDSGIVVTTQLHRVGPVWCKRIEMEQVFINLLDNAVHAVSSLPPGLPRIQVICSRDDDNQAVVEILDNGSGIPESTLARIFEPFFTTKPAGIGTGLGLAICQGIVTAMGGHIDVESTVGVGTRVRVRIPCLLGQSEEFTIEQTRATPAGGVPTVASSTVSARGRVLVVDDEPLIRRVIEHTLHAHEVVTATNGREALKCCRRQDFDVILCDIMMPELNGMEFYGVLSEICPGAERNIIFFSGGSQVDEVHAFLDRIPNECLEKPIQRRRLQQRVEEHVRERRAPYVD